MASAYQNCVKFEIRYKLQYGQAIYIFLRCLQYPMEYYRTECIEMDHEHVWTITLRFSDTFDQGEHIHYCYFIGPYNQQELTSKNFIKWQDQDEIMQLQVKRSDYINSFCHIHDSCNMKKIFYDKNGSPYRLMDKRVKRKSMKQTVALNISIKKALPQGRWMYSMLLPTSMDIQKGLVGDKFLQAQKMERKKLKNTEQYLWKFTWIFTIPQLYQFKQSLAVAFFNSYYYRRLIKYWQAILPDGRKGSIQQIAKQLQKQGVPYQIQIESQIDAVKSQKLNSSNFQQNNPLKISFEYEVTDDIDPNTIFYVAVISQLFGRHQMTRNKNNIMKWNTVIQIFPEEIQGMKYYFQINLVEKVTNENNTIQNRRIVHITNENNTIQNRRIVHITNEEIIKDSRPNIPIHILSRANTCQSFSYYDYTHYRNQKKCLNTSNNQYYRSNIQYPHFIFNQSSTNTSGNNSFTSGYFKQNKTPTYSTFTTRNIINKNNIKNIKQKIIHESGISTAINNIRNCVHGLSYRNNSNVVRTLQNIEYNNNEIINYKNIIENISKQQLQNISVKKLLQPIKLKIISKTQIQEIKDNFQKAKQNLKQQLPQITSDFQRLKQLRNKQNKSQDQIVSNNMSKFLLQIILIIGGIQTFFLISIMSIVIVRK